MQGMISEMELLTAHSRSVIAQECGRQGVRRLVLRSGNGENEFDSLEFEVEFQSDDPDKFSFYVIASMLIDLFGPRAHLSESDQSQQGTEIREDVFIVGS